MSATPPFQGLRVRNRLLPIATLSAASLAMAPAGAAATARVTIDTPRAEATLSGKTVVFVSTSRRARNVRFYVDGAKRHTDAAHPYRYSLDTRKLHDGKHSLTVRAAFGRRKASASKDFTVANGPTPTTATGEAAGLPELAPPAPEGLPELAVPVAATPDRLPPTVSFRAPSSGEQVSGTLSGSECEARASDNVRIERVVFSVDGRVANVQRVAPYNCSFASTEVSDGSHTLTAVAYDGAGNQSAPAATVVDVENDEGSAETPPSPPDPVEPAPPASPAPLAPPAPPIGGRTVFVGDFETGSFGQWRAVQSEAGGSSKIVSTARQGRYAAAFTVPAGGKRAEVYQSGDAYVSEGDERIYRWSTMPAPGYQPSSLSNYEVILQWKNEGTGSPPMAFEIEGPNYAVKTPSGLRSAGPINAGQWTDFELRAKFSASASTGWVELRRNGSVVIPRYSTANMRPGLRNYLKMGLYRGSSASTTGTVYHDGMTVVAP